MSVKASFSAAAAAFAVLMAGAAHAQAPASGDAMARCSAETSAKRFTEAKAACDEAAAGGSADGLTARGRMYSAQEKWDAAIADFGAALDANPRHASALYFRALARMGKKDLNEFKAARVDLETASLMAPTNIEYLLLTGELIRAFGEHDVALTYYDKAIKANPASIPALMGKGHTLNKKGDTAGALKVFDAAVKAAPNDAQPLHWRGHMYQQSGDWARALADFTTAVAISPRSADILSDRGDALRQLKRESDALASYDAAVRADPTYVRGVLSRGRARQRAGDLLGARSDFELAARQKANVDHDLDAVDQALTRAYAAPLISAREALKAADPGGVSCNSNLPTASAYESNLRSAGGDVSTAERKLTESTLVQYRECLSKAQSSGTAATGQLPALRLKMADLLDQQAVKTAELKTACAASPDSKAVCDEFVQLIAEESQKLKSDLKLIEAAALNKGASAAEMAANATRDVDAALGRARTEFQKTAAADFADAVDVASLQRQVGRVNNASVRTLYSACGSIHLYAPNEHQVDQLNQQLNNHRDCLRRLGQETSTVSYDLSSDAWGIERALTEVKTYAGFRCSVRPGAGCVDDAAWTRVANLATPAMRDRAKSLASTAGAVPDQVTAELTRIEDAVSRINKEIKAHNNSVAWSNALQAFADAFNAASQQTYRTY
jgi:tetratricopeptide (TPR) repeat protein